MGQVAVTVNGRSYEIACDDGQEEHLVHLARDIDNRVRGLARSVGKVDETRLLLMASLLVADELSEAYAQIDALRDGTAAATNDGTKNGDRGAKAIEDAITADIDALTEQIEAVVARLRPSS
ncbi:MAG: cell division protein ZapA [Rhodospirillales bacterium]|nr:cell division protein ZapA [Rhodospirillales bacterium]